MFDWFYQKKEIVDANAKILSCSLALYFFLYNSYFQHIFKHDLYLLILLLYLPGKKLQFYGMKFNWIYLLLWLFVKSLFVCEIFVSQNSNLIWIWSINCFLVILIRTNPWTGWIVSALLAGATVGSFTGGALADKFGRTRTFQLDAIPLAIGGFLWSVNRPWVEGLIF